MAEKTSISLSMTDAFGSKMTKAVTDVNPAADNAALKSFAQGLAALTTNTLNTISKISKTDISGTSYTLVLTADNITDDNVTVTKVDDTHYTIPHAGLTAAEEGFNTCSFSFKINNVSATLKGDTSFYVVPTAWSSENVFVSTYISDATTGGDINKIGIALVVGTDNADTDYVGFKFDFIVESTQSTTGKVTDKLVVHFEIV